MFTQFETKVTIEVPFRAAGNIIHPRPVDFTITQQNQQYKAVALLSDDDQRISGLPDELVFKIENGKAISPKGHREGYLHIIEELAAAIQKE
jgi:hypothetical protein